MTQKKVTSPASIRKTVGNGPPLENKVKELESQLTKLTEIASRAQADLQNFKERQNREADDLRKFASAPLILALLPIRDDLARAALQDGNSNAFQQILNKFDKLLANIGLKKIEALGKSVNPHEHEVLTTGKGERDIILSVFEEGYTLHGRVLRPAKVQVGDGSSAV